MSHFTCKICNSTLHSRFHVCGVEDKPHKVEIFGGGAWGKLGMTGGENKQNS